MPSLVCRLYLAFLSVVVAFSCAPPRTDPYAASFDAPLPTNLTLINGVDSTISVSFWPAYLLEGVGKDTPDSIAAGDSLTVTLDLHQAGYVVTEMPYRRNNYDLLPGRDRTVVYGPKENTTYGPHAATYRALDRSKDWLPWTIGQELTGLLYDDFVEHMRERGTQALDSLQVYLQRHPDLPPRVAYMMEAQIRLRALKNMTGYANYRRFFYGEEHTMSRWLSDTVDAALAAYTYGDVPDYGELLTSLTIVRQNARMDVVQAKQSASTRNYIALMDVYLDLPEGEKSYTARGDLAMEIIGKDRDFTDRDLILDSLLAHLPEAYRQRVHHFAESFAASRGDEGLSTLFASRLLEEGGDSLRVAEQRTTPLTLYKFWFAGCYPCILQYPDEGALLARYPDLRIHTIAFKTSSEDWSSYLLERRPPGSRHFFVAPDQLDLVADALVSLGAPQYVLVSEKEVVCRSCPKPSDPLLKKMIEEAVAVR